MLGCHCAILPFNVIDTFIGYNMQPIYRPTKFVTNNEWAEKLAGIGSEKKFEQLQCDNYR